MDQLPVLSPPQTHHLIHIYNYNVSNVYDIKHESALTKSQRKFLLLWLLLWVCTVVINIPCLHWICLTSTIQINTSARTHSSSNQASVVVSCCPIRDRDPWSRDTCWPISGGYPWTRQTNYQLSPWHPFISFPLQHTAAATAQLSFSSCQSVPVPVTARTLTLELMRPFQTGDAVTEPVF